MSDFIVLAASAGAGGGRAAEAVAAQAGLTLAQFALAWVLREPNVASAIVGASRPEQVHANASASGIVLSADTLAAVDEALGDLLAR